MTQKQLKTIEAYVKKAMAQSIDPQHNFAHVDQVRHNALKIVNILKIESEIDSELLQAMCLLHDLCYSVKPPGIKTWLQEVKYTKQILEKDLPQFKLNAADKYLLREAIYKHKGPFPFRRLNKKYSLYAQILQDADSLEFISKIRILGLHEAKKFSRFYRIASLFSGMFIKRVANKNNVKKHFNLPQIIEYLTENNL